MVRAQNPNIEILELAVEQLGDLVDEMVFLGGCATGLLLTDAAAPPIRVTRDVDVITEVASLAEFHRLSSRLRRRGFAEDQSPEAPLCRWVAAGVVLDVMPTDERILGFGNPWYRLALSEADEWKLPSGHVIRMVRAPHFLATKLVAFDDRGHGDFMMSHDIEDVVAVLDGRPELIEEVKLSNDELRKFLAERFENLLVNDRFLMALPGHLQGGAASPDRTPDIVGIMRKIAKYP